LDYKYNKDINTKLSFLSTKKGAKAPFPVH
jgi:hypothetical protein